MITVYECKKEESNVKGYWKDDKGILHVDNIQLKFLPQDSLPYILNNNYKRGELAVFYTFNNKAYIASQHAETIELQKCILKTADTISEETIKEYCDLYNGCTVFKGIKKQQIEAWTN